MGTILFLSLYYLFTVYSCTYSLSEKNNNSKMEPKQHTKLFNLFSLYSSLLVLSCFSLFHPSLGWDCSLFHSSPRWNYSLFHPSLGRDFSLFHPLPDGISLSILLMDGISLPSSSRGWDFSPPHFSLSDDYGFTKLGGVNLPFLKSKHVGQTSLI